MAGNSTSESNEGELFLEWAEDENISSYDEEGNKCKLVYNYINGQIKYMTNGENKNYNIYNADNQLTAAIECVDGEIITNTYSYAAGRYAKFATTEQSQVRAWIAQALKSSNATFYPNGSNSYYIITNMGKVIGTKGERFIKVVFDAYGNIWTAFPKK